MSGAVPPLPQYAFMAWCPVKAQGQLYIYLFAFERGNVPSGSIKGRKYLNRLSNYQCPKEASPPRI
jgi:hypothetical protein